jgi:Gas vesicle synthesis protein GvpL/GvpF
MSVYLYAVCEADAAVLPVETGSSEQLGLVVSDGLAALISEDRRASPSPSVDELWDHERAVEKLMDTCDVLPARYGSELDDRDAVAGLLRNRGDELAAALRRVGGAVELAVRAGLVSAPRNIEPADPSDERRGTAYMAANLARDRSARALARRLHGALEPLSRAGRMRPTLKPILGCTGAYLVPRNGVEAFRERVEQLAELGDAAITCTGPWPPYSFAELPGWMS